MKMTTGMALLALSVATAGTANANMIIFDGNNGGVAKSGSVATGSGTVTGSGDVKGDPLGFSGFSVSAGFSTSTNLAGASFNRSGEINETSVVYQDLTPAHGGLGAFSDNADDGFKPDTDNLESNLVTASTGDEVLFFDFDYSVILDQVWFNGGHKENVAFTDNGGFDAGDTLFNIFFSTDGDTYTSVLGGQQAPIDQEYLMTGLTSAYSMYAIAASGWNAAPGGYVEAIKYSSVPEPGTLALFGLGLAGLSLAGRKRTAKA